MAEERKTHIRPFFTYRGWRRNALFGRRPVGNTKPQDKAKVRAVYAWRRSQKT